MLPGGTGHTGVSAPPGAISNASDAQLAALAYTAGWRGNNTIIATAVALAESGGRVDAQNSNTNGTTDYGLWQVNSVHFTESGWKAEWTPPDLLIPEANAQAAYHVWQGSGWTAWTTYTTGAYLPYMARAKKAYVASGASGARGNVHIPTSMTILGIPTPNWLGGFNNPSLIGTPADAVQSVSNFFKNFSILSFVKILGGGLLLLLGIYILIKAA
jgi:hypothetical protein